MKRILALGLAVAAGVVPPALGQSPPTKTPGELVVALSLPSTALQTGSVIGSDVVYAEGMEIDLTRALAAQLGIAQVRFVNQPFFSRLLTAGPKPWDFALAGVSILPDRRSRVDFSRPYLTADQGVLVRRNLAAPPKTIADLTGLQLCTERNSTGARLIGTTIRPSRKPLLAGNAARLFQQLQTGRCDAAIYDAPILGAEVGSAPDRYGPLVGRIATGERYGIVFPEGSRLRAPVDRALGALITNGTLRGLSTTYLTTDVNALPIVP